MSVNPEDFTNGFGIYKANFWPSMRNALYAKGWRLNSMLGFPFAAEKDNWAVGMVNAHIIDATAAFYEWNQLVENNNIASSRLFVAVFEQASLQNIETITSLRIGNRMLPQAVAAVIHLTGSQVYTPKPAVWDPMTGYSKEPDFKQDIADEIQAALNSILGPH